GDACRALRRRLEIGPDGLRRQGRTDRPARRDCGATGVLRQRRPVRASPGEEGRRVCRPASGGSPGRYEESMRALPTFGLGPLIRSRMMAVRPGENLADG